MKHSTLLTLLLAVGMCGCAKATLSDADLKHARDHLLPPRVIVIGRKKFSGIPKRWNHYANSGGYVTDVCARNGQDQIVIDRGGGFTVVRDYVPGYYRDSFNYPSDYLRYSSPDLNAALNFAFWEHPECKDAQ